MIAALVEQVVHELALELSHTSDCRVLIETDRCTLLGRDVVELRVFLRRSFAQLTNDQWIELYHDHLAEFLNSAGLELAADEWFTPSRRFPSCGCWVTRPLTNPNEERLSGQ